MQAQTQPETAASNAKLEIFKKAAAYAAITRPTIVEDPPLPTGDDFTTEFPPE
jgi:hypothetical protein